MTINELDRTVTTNVLDHVDQLRVALAKLGADAPASTAFSPGFDLPELDERVREFFSVADLRFSELGEVGGRRLMLLDLMRNPGTRTTKTLASLVMIARAVRYLRETGERIMIVTPSSANKATALRDAVRRAYECGLATPDELCIVSVVPAAARDKLWSSTLTTDAGLAARNPLCVLDGGEPARVKDVAKAAADACGTRLREQYGINLWYSLDLDNYRCADAVRAFAEDTARPVAPGVTRTHAHSVSSAFGLLGHHFGRTLLPAAEAPQYFLIQHLATPDMVLSLHGTQIPAYRMDADTGLFTQSADPRFPATTFDPAENLEPTFYTRSPVTSPAMNEIIARNGGGGIVVSLHECLSRYPQIRALLARAGVLLPADPRTVREWSLVMALTGVLNGIDRGLLSTDEVLVHGTGCYGDDDFTRIPDAGLHRVTDARDVQDLILAAAGVEVR